MGFLAIALESGGLRPLQSTALPPLQIGLALHYFTPPVLCQSHFTGSASVGRFANVGHSAMRRPSAWADIVNKRLFFLPRKWFRMFFCFAVRLSYENRSLIELCGLGKLVSFSGNLLLNKICCMTSINSPC